MIVSLSSTFAIL